MKAKRKTALIIATTCLAFDLVLCTGALFAVGFDLEKISTVPKYHEAIYAAQSSETNSIYIDDAEGNIAVEKYDGQAIEVSYWENRKTTYTINVTGNSVSGNIMLDKISSQSIATQTVSGNIDCTIQGEPSDFRTQTSTISGAIHAPKDNPSAARTIEASTTSGNIRLDFLSETPADDHANNKAAQ